MQPQQKKGVLPDWSSLLRNNDVLWRAALKNADRGPRVLIATGVGGHPQLTVLESALAVALTLRGAQVDTLLCDKALPACLRAKISGIDPTGLGRYELSRVFCEGCVNTGNAVFAGTGLNIARISEFVTQQEVDRARLLAVQLPSGEIRDFTLNGWPLGEHAMAGALRYYGRGDLATEPEGETVVRRYLEAAILTAYCMERLLRERRYDAVLINHGIYIPHGVATAICRSAGIRVVTWNLAYRKQCAIFSHGDTYHHTLPAEPATDWENIPWSHKQEKAILAYLDSRQKGTRDWIWFNNSPDDDMNKFAASVGMNWKKPVIGMLTNVVWDAQLHFAANAFSNMVEWVIKTIAYFEQRQDLQLLIRVHPGELAPPGGSTKSRQPIVEEIRQAFPRLPKNVFIIAPESSISTYSTMKKCNAVLIYGTKTGVELTSMGVPVIVAGEAWIRNKGITLDASTTEEYFKLLDELPLMKAMDKEKTQRARKYAYHFFFRRMIPFPFLEPALQAWPPYVVAIDKLDELLPGKFPGLDVVCEGILQGSPFIYQVEKFGLHDLP